MMKKYWRKMMALTCAAAMLFTMAGCGNAEGTTDGAETAQSSTTADGSGEITIQFAEHVADIQAQEPHLQKIITAFEESHPGIKIDITGKEVSEHNTQMTLLAGENKLPDVFWLEQATAKEFAQNGYLSDLTDALDQYGINDSLLPGLVHSCTVDGKDVGMPSEVMMVGFYYNKDLFQQAGIEEVPVTYEEFLDVVDKLNAAGITPLTVGAQDNYSIWAFETMLARYGFFEKLDGLKDGSISWNNEDFIHYFEKVEEMREKGTFTKDISNIGYFEAKEQFLGGNAAMFNSGAWDIGDFEGSDIASKIGIDQVYSDLLPQDKVTQLEKLMGNDHVVAFVGDGINDAPVLARSDIGIAMGGVGSDVAIEAADVVLMSDDITSIAKAIQVSHYTNFILKENVTFTLLIKIGVLVLTLFGLTNMWMGVFADVGVTLIAICNSMRILYKKS